METLFLVCAVLGGVILVCQFVLMLIGVGGDHDIGADHHLEFGGHDADAGHQVDHGSTWYFNVVSFRSLVAAVAFFGLGGLAAHSSGIFALLSFPIALAAGALAMVVVAWLMGLLSGLQSEGTVHMEHALGSMATVYLTIPASGEGAGKVTVKIQDRTMEYQAVTNAPEPLKTGTSVVVLGITGPDTLEVGPASD